jgi:hypothetical protein
MTLVSAPRLGLCIKLTLLNLHYLFEQGGGNDMPFDSH